MTLSDKIELYIKRLLSSARDGMIEIRRGELADRFACVPSQINYVLETRFTTSNGYMVESRRGGGGYIRITRVYLAGAPQSQERVYKDVGHRLTATELELVLAHLVEAGCLSEARAAQIRFAIERELSGMPAEAQEPVRAIALRAVLRVVMDEGDEPQ